MHPHSEWRVPEVATLTRSAKIWFVWTPEDTDANHSGLHLLSYTRKQGGSYDTFGGMKDSDDPSLQYFIVLL